MDTGLGIGSSPRTGNPKQERERAASHYGVSPSEVTPEMIQRLPPRGTGLAKSDIDYLAEAVADKIKEGKFEEDTGTAILILHSLEHQATGAGRVIDAAKAKATPCTCFGFEGEEYCWSPGVLGLMSSKKNPEQIAQYCEMGKERGGAGAATRFGELKSAIDEAHKEWEKEGGDLKKWWGKVSEKMEEKGIEI